MLLLNTDVAVVVVAVVVVASGAVVPAIGAVAIAATFAIVAGCCAYNCRAVVVGGAVVVAHITLTRA